MSRRLLIACALLAAFASPLGAQPAEPSAPAAPPLGDKRLAVMKMDALGMDAVRVARLETLFRKELERLAGAPLPSLRDIDKVVRSSRRLRGCTAEDACLAAIGKQLGVDLVVSGNVAALGDSYVVDIKVVDVGTGQQVRRIASDPLRGSPDELIEAVRVAAYRLLAPEELRGSVLVLTDLVGASVTLDDRPIGPTPLPGPITGLELGTHRLRVEAAGYEPFDEPVEVRFQKTSRVLVRLVVDRPSEPQGPVVAGRTGQTRPPPTRWYNSTWFYIGAGVTAAIIGGYAGYRLGRDPVIDCGQNPMACVD